MFHLARQRGLLWPLSHVLAVSACYLTLASSSACATTAGHAMPRPDSGGAEYAAALPSAILPSAPSDTRAAGDVDLVDGSLANYIAYAFAHSPELRASFEEWQSAAERPQQARKLPEPTITYTGFVRSVETRVGPQRHKLGAMQWFPWPTQLSAASRAATARSESFQRRFQAHALQIAATVSREYWEVWFIERHREVLTDLVALLRDLSAQVRARVVTGTSDLAGLAQVDLRALRLDDVLAGVDDRERAARAELVRVLGAPVTAVTPVSKAEPTAGSPPESPVVLIAAAKRHPRVQATRLMSRSYVEQERRARARRYPSAGLGVDWVITGPAMDPTMADSGKDAVMAMAAVRVPLWQGAYGAAEREASAKRRAYDARVRAVTDAAAADVHKLLARIDDLTRRVALYETTLIPQAETVFVATQGSYQVGRAAIADLLLAERDLLELSVARYRALADFAITWAALESTVGHQLVKIDKAIAR